MRPRHPRLIALFALVALMFATTAYVAHGFQDGAVQQHATGQCDLCLQFSGTAGAPTDLALPGKPPLVVVRTTQVVISSTALRDLGRFITSARVRATFNNYRHAEIEGSGDVGTLFEQQGSDTRLVFDHAPLAGWRGTFGVQYRDIALDVTGEEALVPPSSTTNSGAFLFEERPFGDLTLELGARLEHQHIHTDREGAPRYQDNALSGSAGVVWKLAPVYSIALKLTSTQRHPTATELYADGPHIAAQRFEIGDATLRQERAMTMDPGFRKTAGSWPAR